LDAAMEGRQPGQLIRGPRDPRAAGKTASGGEMPVGESEQDSRAIRSRVPRVTLALPDRPLKRPRRGRVCFRGTPAVCRSRFAGAGSVPNLVLPIALCAPRRPVGQLPRPPLRASEQPLRRPGPTPPTASPGRGAAR
jgi:hypothetical protein